MSEALADDEVLLLRRGARLKHCEVRQQWLLLVPERVLFPCPTTMEVLRRLERPTQFGAIVGELAREYDAPRDVIRADIVELLSGLMEKGYVRRAHA